MLNLTTILASVSLAMATVLMPATHISPAKTNPMKHDIASLTITSTAFKANEMIPDKYTCKGANVSPPLHVEGIPEGTKALVLILDDPDAQHEGGFNHWVVWNLDPTMIDIPEGYKGAVQGFNTGRHKGYMGPCPPQGTHHYHFRVYALKKMLTASPDSYKDKIERDMKGLITAQGELVGLFTKMK